MFRKSILASSLSLLLLPSGVWALGLGGIRPESALNQPFVGEIDLIGANPDELDAVKVSLATEAEFAKRGVDRQHYLTKLRFKPQVSPRGKAVIRVTTVEPIREPYMDFLVEAVWPKGRMVKGYTVLLDPPVTSRRSPPPATPAMASAGPAPRRADEPRPTSPPPRAVVAPAQSAVQSAADGFPLSTGPIKRGAGLWRTARNIAPPGATVAQTAMALYRSNQQAFVRGDINVLRQGEVLQIPSAAELFALDAAEAEREYQAALGGQRVTSQPLTDVTAAAADQGSRLRIAGSSGEAGRDGSASDQAAAAAGAGVPPDMERELLLVRETSESTRQEADELRTRVQQLEARLADIQSLLTLRNAELARLQGAGGAAAIPSEAELSDVPTEPSGLSRPGVAEPGTEPAGLNALPQPMSQDQVGLAEGVAPGGADLQSAPETKGEAPGEMGSGFESPPAGPRLAEGPRAEPEGLVPAMATKPERGAEPVAAESDQPGESWLGGVPLVGGALKALPTQVLWALALAVPLLGTLGWLSVRRRRRLEESLVDINLPSSANLQDEPTSVMVRVSETTEAFDEPELEAAAPSEVAGSEYGSLDLPEEEADESDVIAEADIYIAYGRYRDAEGLLKQAIARSPRRADLRFKLADVFAGARNQDGLVALMREMELVGMDKEQPEQWARLAGLATTAGSERGGPTAAPAALDLGEPLDLGELPQEGTPAAPTRAATRAVPQQPTARLGLSGASMGRDSSPGADKVGEVADDLRSRDLDFDLADLRLPSDSTGAAFAADSDADAESGVDRSDDSGVELDFADLTLATDVDLNELGFPGAPASAGDKPVEPDTDVVRGSAFAPVISLDSESLGEDTGTSVGVPDSEQIWGAQVSPSVSPSLSPQLRPPSAAAASQFDLRSIEQDDASSDLLSSDWPMEGGVWDEVATKLDLGRAYVEMNDRAAAESILNEVADEGNPEQQAEAQELLARLKGN